MPKRLLRELGLESMPAGVLWDMDGTIIDTEPEWLAASIAIVEEHGGIWHHDKDPQRVLGVSSEDHAKALADAVRRGGEEADAWELFDQVVTHIEKHIRAGVPLIPGAGELLDFFQENAVPQALVTASPRNLVQALVDGIPHHPFTTFVSGSDDIPGKPNPAPYLLGADRLGVDIAQCLAFEDSMTGLAAARGSGATVHSVTERPLTTLLEYLPGSGNEAR